MATWSLRLRPVWSLAPAGPASSVTRRSIAVWMSSSEGANANVPPPISASTISSAVSTSADSAALRRPTSASMRT